MNNNKQDLIIIGGGVAGLVTTSVIAQLGLKVTLIEKSDKLGGDCLHTGCVPSKTFIHTAKVASLMRRGDEFGLTSVEPTIDLAKVNQHVQAVIAQIQEHDDPDRFRDYGAEVLFGDVEFVDSHTITCNGQQLTAKRFLIATGSSPAIPPIPGLADSNYLTNESIFHCQQLPEQLIILGGGVIGLELAQSFVRLGSKVIIVEMLERIVPAVDNDVAELLQQTLSDEGVTFYTSTAAKQVSSQGDKTLVQCEHKNGETLQLECDQLLVATGRAPNVKGLNLEAAGVDYTPRGIDVDSRLRTSAKHIFAAGDVVNSPYKFTHMAEYHAGIVIGNIAFRAPKKVDYRVIPAVIYTDPEVATVGLTEQQAKEQGKEVQIYRFNMKEVDRAITEVETNGMAKIVLHKGKLLGATIIGPQAGELIAEFALALQAKIKLSHLSATIHSYPTLAQINRRVVNAYFGEKLFSTKAKRLVGWLNRWLP